LEFLPVVHHNLSGLSGYRTLSQQIGDQLRNGDDFVAFYLEGVEKYLIVVPFYFDIPATD